jgi:hypothetical protein
VSSYSGHACRPSHAVVLDVYGGVVGTSPSVDALLVGLGRAVALEVGVSKSLLSLQGTLDLLMAAATTGSGEMPAAAGGAGGGGWGFDESGYVVE